MPSSVIRGMRYDPARRELWISFRALRELYVYEDIPADEWTAFRTAPSKGTYLNHVFKAKAYRYRRVPPHDRKQSTKAASVSESDETWKWGETWALPR